MYGAPAPYGQPAYGQPAYMPPPPPPAYYPPPPQPQQGPMIINLGNNNTSGSPCPVCGKDTESMPRKKIGCVAIAWCICLLFTVGGYGLCFIPFCSDSCKDTELICVRCQTIKSKISANCC